MAQWHSYTERRNQHTVTGTLLVHDGIYSPQLKNERPIYVWLPPDYTHSERRYPVIYMHDGENLFDDHSSYAGEWRVDETLTQLHQEGIDAIVVGIPNKGEERIKEYNPYPGRYPGMGHSYIQYLTDTIKPIIDADFRTMPDPAHTAIGGSSMGGLISLYGFLVSDCFGLCLAMSPTFWFGGGSLFRTIEARANGQGKIYLDIGTNEGQVMQRLGEDPSDTEERANRAYRNGVFHLQEALTQRGYTAQNLQCIEEEGAIHNETAWARRLPTALRFIFGAATP